MAVTQETPATSGPRAETPTTTTGSTRRVRRRGEAMMGAAMVAPAALLLIFFFFFFFIIIIIIPMGLCFALAFTNARLISPEPAKSIGFENFTRLFSDPLFWKSLRNTFYFAVVVVPLQSGFALLFLALQRQFIRSIASAGVKG
jgi:multiple sugar transport system permease protein